MRRILTLAALALALATGGAAASTDSTCGVSCGGGGYDQLPTCSTPYVGVTLYVQGHYWYCSLAGSRAHPPYWTLVR